MSPKSMVKFAPVVAAAVFALSAFAGEEKELSVSSEELSAPQTEAVGGLGIEGSGRKPGGLGIEGSGRKPGGLGIEGSGRVPGRL